MQIKTIVSVSLFNFCKIIGKCIRNNNTTKITKNKREKNEKYFHQFPNSITFIKKKKFKLFLINERKKKNLKNFQMKMLENIKS